MNKENLIELMEKILHIETEPKSHNGGIAMKTKIKGFDTLADAIMGIIDLEQDMLSQDERWNNMWRN